MNPEIVRIVNEKGVLLEKELFELLNNFKDITAAKSFLDRLTTMSGQKIITSANLVKNMEYAQQIINTVPGEMRSLVEKTFVTLGISLSIEKHTEVKNTSGLGYQVFYSDTKNNKKVEVADFVGHFRSRYQQIQRILLQRADAQNLISINKLSGVRQNISIIGILTEKRITSNKNLMMTFEDLTGSIKVLVKLDSECYSNAAEIQLDDVVFIRGAGSRDFMYAYEIIFPDSFKEKVRFDGDTCVAFVSDVHAGSLKHLGKEFERFLEWINSEDEMAKKIKFIFFVGDNVDGVGVFPGQERLLNLKSLREQYELLASYLKKIPKDITIFMCPGQHDSVRVAEPQPIIDDFYGKPLREIENLILVSNPSLIKLIEKDKEFKVLMYHGASIHAFISEIQELRLMKAHKSPAKAVKHMLKRRHLAPSHGVSPSIVYVPNVNKDPLVISEVPDILCTGEVHRPDIETYNGTLIITGSCWQAQTEFEEKVGNVPDPCKVPVFNLKTRELKLLDFSL
ncbi:MAG: metallophosphoesterase [Nanoarchaeota archaeon]